MLVVFAVHESSSDPIMTEAALPCSPTANLQLHVPNTHTHAATASSVRTCHQETPGEQLLMGL